MAEDDLVKFLSGEIFEKETELSLADLCRVCQLPAERVIELVQEGVIDPIVHDPVENGPVRREPVRWRFRGINVRRVRCAQRLEQDLGINTAGAALAIELIEELERLRARLRRMED